MVICLLSTTPAIAQGITLYDGMQGGTPDTQLMIFQGVGGSQNAANGVTTLDTALLKGFQAGYSPKPGIVPSLDRIQGFTLQFTIQLTSENHSNSNDRAGFSVIVLASDQQGIELGFWPDRIWAQAGGGNGDGPLFTQAEGATLDTTITRSYTLEVSGATYTLRSGNTLVLNGPLRNYSSFGVPYNVPNFVFFGDDTTSASAIVRISSIALLANSQQYHAVLPLVIR
jgi:hypothetical protein